MELFHWQTFVALSTDDTLDCPMALGWLEQCGVLGHASVRAPNAAAATSQAMMVAGGGSSRAVASVLTAESATDAFVESLPAVSALGPEVLALDAAGSGNDPELSLQLTSLRRFQVSRPRAADWGLSRWSGA